MRRLCAVLARRSQPLAGALAAGALACAGPIVEDHVHEIDPPSLQRIAIAPFQPAPDLGTKSVSVDAPDPSPSKESAPTPPSGAKAVDAAALTTRFVSEAFAEHGFDVIPASDVVQLFTARGQVVPYGDKAAFAEAVAREFGATAVLFGSVDRYRERDGSELGATRAASVGFELELRTAPGARLLWEARFDHTQRALSEDLFVGVKYPGRGSRWLSAAELARWGADAAAERLLELK